jgi:hypothetical protein
LTSDNTDVGTEMMLILARRAAEARIGNLTVDELTALMYAAIEQCRPRTRRVRKKEAAHDANQS